MGSEAEPGREKENRYRCCHRCNKALGSYLLNQLQSIELGDADFPGSPKITEWLWDSPQARRQHHSGGLVVLTESLNLPLKQ